MLRVIFWICHASRTAMPPAHRVSLHDIDAPERGAPFSRAARDHLAELLLRQTVTAHPVSRDRYERLVARLDLRGADVGLELLTAGMVWHSSRYDNSSVYAEAQARARAARRGLWADPRPVPPWEWRATEQQRKRQPAKR